MLLVFVKTYFFQLKTDVLFARLRCGVALPKPRRYERIENHEMTCLVALQVKTNFMFFKIAQFMRFKDKS